MFNLPSRLYNLIQITNIKSRKTNPFMYSRSDLYSSFSLYVPISLTDLQRCGDVYAGLALLDILFAFSQVLNTVSDYMYICLKI